MNWLPLDVCVAALVHCNENVARHYIGARRIAQRCVIGPLFWLWSSNFPHESTCSLTFVNKRVRGSNSLFAAFKFQNRNIFWWITPIIGIEGLSPSLDPRDLLRGVRRLTTGLRMGGARIHRMAGVKEGSSDTYLHDVSDNVTSPPHSKK